MAKHIDTNKELLEILNTLAPEVMKTKAGLMAASILSADRGPDMQDMPSDEEMEQQFRDFTGNGNSNGNGGNNQDNDTPPPPENNDGSEESDGTDAPNLDDLATEPPVEESQAQKEEQPTRVGPYDLTFQLRKIISAFEQFLREAEQLKKQTEGITSNMSAEQQASWIEQRRFFIETAKEAEQKWTEFKKTLLNFSLTPKLE